MPSDTPGVGNNFHAAYAVLFHDVVQALRTQRGDAEQLNIVKQQALSFQAAADLHRNAFSPAEYATLCKNIEHMVEDLDDACHESADPPDLDALGIVNIVSDGRRGRRRIEIDEVWLRQALEMGSTAEIARTLRCSSRTVRRRALRYGLVEPGAPVQTTVNEADVVVTALSQSSSSPVSTLTDNELDNITREGMALFPDFGRRNLASYIACLGHRVPRDRLQASYLRVHGAPPAFHQRRIKRRRYKVPGPNSLWHHDGQHGLIRYKMVIHLFIDGYSRFVTGVRVSNNNRASTVLDLFLEAHRHGVPSRVRGDHGTENLEVASWMEAHRGLQRGSYIWGRSVHNTRVERIWVDVTNAFGRKWKEFFIDLEWNHGLDPSRPSHIWLVHHLFLHVINSEAQIWAEVWNCHKLRTPDEGERTPKAMFFFGMVQHGLRGTHPSAMEPVSDDVDNFDEYGVEPDALTYMSSLSQHAGHASDTVSVSLGSNMPHGAPSTLSQVLCDSPDCPLTMQQIGDLDGYLMRSVDRSSTNMIVRRDVWRRALAACVALNGDIF